MKSRTMGIVIPAVAAIAIGAAVYVWSARMDPAETAAESQQPDRADAIVAVTMPDLDETAQMGRRAFAAKCAECHGPDAGGVDGKGPPLIHEVYEPSHHGDMAFVLAAQQGVRAHHWRFGDMPPVDGLTEADLKAIIAYVRSVQEANGIL